jgi:hypothetical protein
MNYVMGDFGFIDSILSAGSTWINNPTNQQQLINAGLNLIAPKPKAPKPASPAPLPATVIQSAPLNPQQKDNTMLYVGLGVAGVALVAVVAGLVMAKKK